MPDLTEKLAELRGLERLTFADDTGEALWSVIGDDPCDGCDPYLVHDCNVCPIGKMINRLALYETHVPALLAELDALREMAGAAEECEVTYALYNPADEGYHDGCFYRCSCGAGYIDTQAAMDHLFCPRCGGKIIDWELPPCSGCQHAEPEYGSLWCPKIDDWVEGNHTNGCKHYRRGPQQEGAEHEGN